MVRPNGPKPIDLISTRYGIKYIGHLYTTFTWRYGEPPVDMRAMDGLQHLDLEMYNEVQEWQRKHGGFEGISMSLNGYDRIYPNFNHFSEAAREDWDRAYQSVKSWFTLPEKVVPRSERRYRPGKSNSGYPYYMDRKEIIDNIYDETHEFANKIRYEIDVPFVDLKAPPVTPMLKSMPSLIAKGIKTRGIWCYPAVMTCLEDMFVNPLYEKILKYRDANNIPLMHGVGSFTIARAFTNSIDINEGMRVMDWVKGDTQVPPFLIKMAKGVLEANIDFKRFEYYSVSKKWSDANKRVWDYIWWYFEHTPFVFGDELFRKTSGIPSGSMLTLLSWSIISLIVASFLALRVEKRLLDKRDVRACGDDNAARVRGKHTIDEYINEAALYGIKFHGAPKSGLAYYPDHHDLLTLSTKFTSSTIERDEVDLFARAVFPSRWISCREESVARILMLDLSVLKTMKRFHDFVIGYYLWKPVYLKKVISSDRDLDKYFKYVTNAPEFRFPSGTKLIDLVKVHRNDLLVTRLFFAF